MATTKMSAANKAKTVASTKTLPKKSAVKNSTVSAKQSKEKSINELVSANFTALSTVVDSLSATLEMLVQKTESMAYHIIASEEVLAELVEKNGLNLARVNARIRTKIAVGTDNNCNSNQAIDIAASIASPLPRR